MNLVRFQRRPPPDEHRDRRIHVAGDTPSVQPATLRFAPLAWLKLQFLCHAGDTEVGGFGVSAAGDLLYVQRVETVLQGATPVGVEFADDAVADHFDRCADQGIPPGRCGRIWIHTHPGWSPEPSAVDEATFARVFGPCDWALMFILSRTGRTYARARFSAGPGGSCMLPVEVDWASWPEQLDRDGMKLQDLVRQWRHEYDANVYNVAALAAHHPLRFGGSSPIDEWWLDDADERWGELSLESELEVRHVID